MAVRNRAALALSDAMAEMLEATTMGRMSILSIRRNISPGNFK